MSPFRRVALLFTPLIRKYRFSKILTFLAVFFALVAGTATYVFFTNTEFLFSNPRKVILLLNFDLAVLLFLGIIVARQLVKVWVQRRSGQAGAKLHVRLVIIFSTLTAVPAITVALFSAYFFNAGIQSWFNDRVKMALTESSVIAKAYLEEHKKVISANVHGMAGDIGQQMDSLMKVPEIFNQFLDLQIDVRHLDEALVFSTSSQILARSRFTFVLEFERLAKVDLKNAEHTVVIKTNQSGDRVRALIKIPQVDAYLLVGRVVDSTVLKRINLVEKAVGEYAVLQNRLSDLELKFTLIFILLSLLLLFVATWLGLLFATRLVKPIRSLITVAERVRTGDLSARVAEPGGNDEFTVLAHEFNRMTEQLQGQQKKLLQVNKQLEARRKFIEDVLAGVTAGIMGLSPER
ncbi:MAG: HAMP domain-containing protein, partial [Alphaproteobacteria bacterium]|nr:HAMP domain-containing protein [Alphaproteobacteria bacterium]